MNINKFGVFKLILLCVIVAIVSAVPTLAVAKSKNEGIEQNLKGNMSPFQGVLTIWNVDTFESGSQSKTVFIEHVGAEFSKKNEGLYFMIKNLTVEEMTQNLMSGIYPDILSFGYGIGGMVQPLLEDLSNLSIGAVRNEVIVSGSDSAGVKAVGYLMGGYALISTEEKLLNAGQAVDVGLSSIINSAGFDTETSKGVKHTASLVMGENEFVKPHEALEIAYGLGLEDVFKSASSYDAYLDFVGYQKGSILVGTHRDLFKISGRVKVGKVSGVKIEFVQAYTNLIQYVGVMKGLSETKHKLASSFVEFLVSFESQEYSTQIGMVNTIGASFYEDGEFKGMEDVLNKPILIPNLFS